MVDGSLTLKFDGDLAARLEEAAAQAGEPAQAFAERLLLGALETDRWAIANARIEEYERTGVAEDAEAFFDRMLGRLEDQPADQS
jgi:hypothetical protein